MADFRIDVSFEVTDLEDKEDCRDLIKRLGRSDSHIQDWDIQDIEQLSGGDDGNLEGEEDEEGA